MTGQYNPTHHHRQSIRLKGWDYRWSGIYFVTICTHQREPLFDDPRYGNVARDAWLRIPQHPHAAHVSLDEWIVMPDHLHGLLVLVDGPSAAGRSACPGAAWPIERTGRFAGGDHREFQIRGYPAHQRPARHAGAPVWQRNYYERIVRDEKELNAIRQYIRDNPARFEQGEDDVNALIARVTARL